MVAAYTQNNMKSHVDEVLTAGSYDVIKPLTYDEKNDKLCFIASPNKSNRKISLLYFCAPK